jgi:hypothetical protein
MSLKTEWNQSQQRNRFSIENHCEMPSPQPSPGGRGDFWDYLPEGEGTSGICFRHFNRVGAILPAVPVGLVMRVGKDLIN